jgi:hypothetical protein
MKPLDLIISFVLLSIILFGCVQSSEPVLDIKRNEIDLGSIPFDSSILVRYQLMNAGTGKLVIDTATASCDCTIPYLEKKELIAGDSGFLEVRFKPVDTGRFEKKVVIKSNISQRFSVVSFKGNAIK